MDSEVRAGTYDVREHVCGADGKIQKCEDAVNLTAYVFRAQTFTDLYTKSLTENLKKVGGELEGAVARGLITDEQRREAEAAIASLDDGLAPTVTMESLLRGTDSLPGSVSGSYTALLGIGLLMPQLERVNPDEASPHLDQFLELIGPKDLAWYLEGSAEDEPWRVIRTLHYARRNFLVASCSTASVCQSGKCEGGEANDSCIQNSANQCANCSVMVELKD